VVRCPYFDCYRQQEIERPLARDVYRCPDCGRLSVHCKHGAQCDTINRPFMRYCRRCGNPVADDRFPGKDEPVWEAAARFDYQQVACTNPPREPVITLSTLKGFRESRALLAMRILDGLLAVHQAGAYLLLLHPFRSYTDSQSPEFYHEEDRRFLLTQECRPFPPLKMKDRRYILFAHSRAVYAVNVWSLPGWVRDGEEKRFHTLIDCSNSAANRLACAPVTWDDAKLGVISRDSAGNYWWAVFDLAAMDLKAIARGSAFTDDLRGRSIKLPVTGESCRAETIGSQVLVITTADGHWVGRLKDASTQRFETIQRTWPCEQSTGRLIPNRHDQDPKEYHALRQYLFCNWNRELREPSKYTHFFQEESKKDGNRVWCYSVDCETLERDNPVPLDTTRGAIPLGSYQPSDAPPQMLFCGKTGLYYEDGRLQLQELSHMRLSQVAADAQAVVFHDPVLMILEQNTLFLHCLKSLGQSGQVTLPRIRTEPLLWSHWLFTIEGGAGEPSCLWRLELPSA